MHVILTLTQKTYPFKSIKSWLTDEKIAFALKQEETGTRIDGICLKMGISDATFYK
jgi:hypothetical protein